MNIIIDDTPEKRKALSSFTGKVFNPPDKINSDSVFLCIRDSSMDLDEAVKSGCPVVVIAGVRDKAGEAIIQKARSLGIPDECIIVKNGDTVKTCSGVDLGPAVRGGISVKQAVKVAEYAHQKKLYPEMLIWEERKESPKDQEETIWSPPAQEQKKTKPAPKIPAVKTHESVPMDFDDFLKDYSIVLGIVLEGDSPGLFKEVAAQLNACHVEMADKPTSYRVYADNLDEALTKGYGYANQKTAMVPVGTKKAVVEVTLTDIQPDMLDKAYRRAEKIIHIAGINSVPAVKDWLASGYKLDAIVTEDRLAYEDISVPAASTPEEVVKILKGGLD
ncbi:MAG: hypothetical protein GXY92_08720 [Syntrophomonadaceae bacterium]|nr:hypothetical protein [Syntrophomonadaceae bacterium]